MRKFFWLLFLVAIISNVACTKIKKESLVIGVSIPTQREERWVRDVQKLTEVAVSRGIQLKLQISDNDAARQLSQSENLFAQGVDVLILAPHDAFAAAVIVERAHRLKIPVISYDRLVMNSDVDIYLSFDNAKVGELQGSYLTNLVPRGRYVVLSGAPTDNNAKLFYEGAMKFIRPLVTKGLVTIVMDQPVKDWQPVEAMKLMENALTATSNKVDGVLAPNDGTAGGVIQALAQQRLAGKIPVTGQDAEIAAVRRIVEGLQTMTVYKDTRELAKTAIDVAQALAAGRTPKTNGSVYNGRREVLSVLLPPTVVDNTNLNKVLINSGYFKHDDVYRRAY